MKCTPDNLGVQLKKGMSPVFLVCGDEPLQLMECCDLIRSTARSNGFEEREIFQVDKKFDWTDLYVSTQTVSLFAQRRIIELRIGTGKLGDKGGKALLELLVQPPDDTILLVIADKLEKSTQRTKWYMQLEKIGLAIQVWPIEAKQLPAWIQRRMQAKGLRPSRDAVNILSERVEGNMLAAAQEIEKLVLVTEGDDISADDIEAAVADSARFDVYGLVDVCLAANHKRVVRMLDGLKAEGVESILLLWALTREIRTMAAMAKLVESGHSVEQVLATARVWPKRKALVGAGLKRHNAQRWELLLTQASQIDQMIKGMATGIVWDQLLQLCLAITGLRLFKPSPQFML